MRTLLISLLVIITTTICYGQNDVTNDTIHPYTFEYKPVGSSQSKQVIDRINNSDYSSDFNKPMHVSNDTLMKRLNLSVPSFYVGPGDNPDRIPTTLITENNYAYRALWGISDRAWLTTLSERRVYPVLGAVTNINAMLSYQLSERWIVSGGPYVSKYSINTAQFNDLGASGQLKYIAHDRISLNIFGTYSVNGKKNDIGSNYSGLFMQNSYGGTVEFKLTPKFGVETGLMRQLDPVSGRWKNIPIINPVFYVK